MISIISSPKKKSAKKTIEMGFLGHHEVHYGQISMHDEYIPRNLELELFMCPTLVLWIDGCELVDEVKSQVITDFKYFNIHISF